MVNCALPIMPATPKGGKIEALPIELREKAFELYRRQVQTTGKPDLNEIAQTLNVEFSTIAAWSSRGKWKNRVKALPMLGNGKPRHVEGRQDGPPISAPESQPVKVFDVEKALALTFAEKQTSYKDRLAIQALRIADAIETLPTLSLIGAADKVEKLDKIARKALCLETASPAVVVNVALLSQGSQPSVVVALPSSQSAIALPSSEHLTTVEHTGNNPEDAVLEAVTLPA